MIYEHTSLLVNISIHVTYIKYMFQGASLFQEQMLYSG